LARNGSFDFIRKRILEDILNNNLNNLKAPKQEIDLLYNIKVKYINLNSNNAVKIKEEINNLPIIDFEKVKIFLNENNYQYFTKEKEVSDINRIDQRVKSKILSNNKFFIIEKDNFLSFIFIDKSFETFDGIVGNLYSVKSKEELDNNFLKCENLLKLRDNQKIINKEYKLNELNENLKNNLVDINDYVKLVNENENIYVVLCDLNFDLTLLNNINFNKIVNSNVSEIENEFMNKYSKIFDLIILNE